MKFAIIAAADEKMGIGIGNRLPWRLKGDLKYFSDFTTLAEAGKMNAVIMGRKTWESLPEAHRPLKGRLNVVLSRGAFLTKDGPNFGISMFSGQIDRPWSSDSLDEALNQLGKLSIINRIDKVFVIGGASIYAQAINHIDCAAIYLTEVRGDFKCDAFFPYIPDSIFRKTSESKEREDGGIKYRFCVYGRI